MKKKQIPATPLMKSVEIPVIFHSDLSGAPFKNCVMCNTLLYRDNVPYMIEKAFRYNKKFNVRDTLFEYAICLDCHEKTSSSTSAETLKLLEEYFHSRINILQRAKDLLGKKNINIDEWIGKCVITGTEMKDCKEFQVCCQCEGTKILLSHLPIMLSEAALTEMNELFSAETRKELDNFRDNFLGVPPEWRELIKDNAPVLI